MRQPRSVLRPVAALLAAVPLAAPLAAAGDVHLVDPAGGGDFSSLADALAAAGDGDVLLVRPGTYAGFALAGRGLSVLAVPGSEGLVVVEGGVVVSGLAASQSVTLGGLDLRGAIDAAFVPSAGLTLVGCTGAVRVEGCALAGGGNAFVDGATTCDPGAEYADAAPALLAVGCADVTVVDGELAGGDAMRLPVSGALQCDGRPGAPALSVEASNVAVHGAALRGGDGGTGSSFTVGASLGGRGGDGAQVLSGFLYVSGATLVGGDGGTVDIFNPGTHGDGGDGLFVGAGATAAVRDAQLAGGISPPAMGASVPGADGQPSVVLGTLDALPGTARGIALAALAGDAFALLRVTGEPGDRVWLPTARRSGFRYAPDFGGAWHVPYPALMPLMPLGTIPGSGTLDVLVPLPALPAGAEGATLYLQAYVRDAVDAPVLGEPGTVTLLDCAVLSPDCDGDGRFDVCDLLDGTPDCDADGVPDDCQADCNANGVADTCDVASGASPDQNENGVPDECEPSEATWYVRADAGPGGDGSQAAPFRTLQQAIDVTLDGDTVVVLDGVYAGRGNRDLDLGGRAITIRSAFGATSAVIDCQGAGRGFLAVSGEGPDTRLEGLTVRNGDASASTVHNGLGGGLLARFASPTVIDCVFEGCSGVEGAGGVHLVESFALVRGCRIEGCQSTLVNHTLPVAAGLTALGGAPLVVDCTVVGNVGTHTGGVALTTGSVVASRILENVATSLVHAEGGGVLLGAGDCRLDGCLVAGNQAPRGAGVQVRGTATITNTTLVHNHALETGGALRLAGGARAGLFNALLALNAADGAGAAIALQGAATRVGIEYSRLPSAGAIHQESSPWATVVLGPGIVSGPPEFLDPDGPDDLPGTTLDNDYRLGLFSRCVDAGRNGAVPPDFGDVDGDGDAGEAWPLDLAGAPRFQDDPSTADTGAGTAPIVDLGAYER